MKWLWLACAAVCSAAPPQIAIVGGPQALWPEITQEFARRYPLIDVRWQFQAGPMPPDVLFAYYPTPSELQTFPPTSSRLLGFPVEFVAATWKRPVDGATSTQAAAYLDEGGLENGVRLLAFLYALERPGALSIEPPLPAPQSGLYHPHAPELFSNYAAYRDWWRSTHAAGSSAIAIPFFSTWLRGHDLAALDALIAQVESTGSMPVAAFGYPLDTVTPLLSVNRVFQPQGAIALRSSLSSATDVEVYESWKVPVLNGLVTRESHAEWHASVKGLPADRVAPQLSFPERAGMIAPTLVATTETSALGAKTVRPVTEGVTAVVERASQLIALQTRPNSAKRVAIIYYNNPAGKGNIGASYLQAFPSMRNILQSLSDAGYTVHGTPDEQALRMLLEANGRNFEVWSKAEGDRMWPIAEYRRYYDALPVDFRREVEATWGTPESTRLMAVNCPQDRCLLMPGADLGNVLLAPQPLRTTFDQASDPGHERVTPPPHQYIAYYLWLRHVWKADAVVHLGRHGTLEWLPGKQTALAESDAPDVLLGALPNFNIYVMDGGGEAIQAKRRGYATLISHLTPMLWRTGGRKDLETLHQSFHELMEQGDSLSPELAAEYEKVTRAEVLRLGLDRQLKLDMAGSVQRMAPALHRFLHEIEDAPVPAGLPIFGAAPSERALRDAVAAFLFHAFPAAMHDEVEPHITGWADHFLAGTNANVNADEQPAHVAAILQKAAKELPAWIAALRGSGQAELRGLLNALNGVYVPTRLLGDPLRKPEALPTGGNLHAVDSARIPTEAAWRVGQTMAADFLQRYQDEHGELPSQVSFVLWYGETERHQGAMESMALALLGVEPVWNARGVVDELRLIPEAALGRARVDVLVTASGNYRDGFPEKLQLLDRAIRLAATAEGSIVAVHDRSIAAQLMKAGLAPQAAQVQSALRVFSAKPGAYGVGVQNLVERSGGTDSAKQIANLFSANMGYGFSDGAWGTPSEAALRANFQFTGAIQFSRSSNLYAALDNDDTYQYTGGLRTAVEAVTGRSPDVVMHNLRRDEAPKMASLREWLAVELHSRQLNPTWIAEMRDSGYAGARELSREIEHLYGFQKTTPDHLDPATWQTVLDVYVKDKYQLGLRPFFAQQNPHARQALLARLIDVDRQGIHKFSGSDKMILLTEFAHSVARDGAACMALDCGSAVLTRHAAAELQSLNTKRAPDTPTPDLRNWKSHFIKLVNGVKGLTKRALPWWFWPILLGVYAASAVLRTRRARYSRLQLLDLREERP